MSAAPNPGPRRVAVVGSGTGIGKTHVTAALLREAARSGIVVAGRKPIESGVERWETSDAGILDAAGSLQAATAPPYRFVDPVSPHLAARRAGSTLELDVAARWCVESAPGAALLLVETAGALLSPLDRSPSGRVTTNLDLVFALAPAVVLLVAPDRLGVLHEVSAARLILPTGLWARTLVVLVAPAEADASTGTNGAELEALGITSEVATWPRFSDAVAAPVLERVLRL